jgi:hypothetical protein
VDSQVFRRGGREMGHSIIGASPRSGHPAQEVCFSGICPPFHFSFRLPGRPSRSNWIGTEAVGSFRSLEEAKVDEDEGLGD